MTYAPDSLKAARQLLLNLVPGLAPLAVGIVGDDSHARSGSSYHLGEDALRPDSYTIVESARDRAGLTDAASALDVGKFRITVGGRVHTLADFSVWLVAQCAAGTADTADIREVIYSPDGRTVKRWDRLKRRSTGDDSHLSHTHISWFRDSERRDKTAVFKRWFTDIGLLEDSVALTPDDIAKIAKAVATAVWTSDGIIPAPAGAKPNADGTPNTHWAASSYVQSLYATAVSTRGYAAAVKDAVGQVDENVLAALADVGRSDEDVAAALRAALGGRAAVVGHLLAGS